VDVPASADVFSVSSDGGSAHVDAIDRSQLAVADEVSAFGVQGASCLQASTVIVLDGV
jgi:hypothetical protein